MKIYRTQQFIDTYGQVYEVTAASSQIVFIDRVGDLPSHVKRSFTTTPELVERSIAFGRWSVHK